MRSRLLPLGLAATAAVLAGCVEIPAGVEPVTPRSTTTITPVGIFPGLDPGGKDVTGLHFKVFAYGSSRADEVSQMAEAQYNRIMSDTGLYSFQPPGLYSIVVYGTHDEFMKKTQQPEWSGGVTVGNAIYSFDSAQLAPILAHEMTHLIFHEYMGSARIELRWINEGLAVYEEQARAVEAGLAPGDAEQARRNVLRSQAVPFDQMVNLVPATEKDRLVGLWYQQVGDVVRFLVERGGHNGFSQFLSLLRDGRPVEDALRSGFPGSWQSLAALESAWRGTL